MQPMLKVRSFFVSDNKIYNDPLFTYINVKVVSVYPKLGDVQKYSSMVGALIGIMLHCNARIA